MASKENLNKNKRLKFKEQFCITLKLNILNAL